MKTLDLQQGSEAWAQIRAKHRTASEASAMMGCSTKVSRAELVRMYAIGNEQEFSAWVQKNLLDKGHEIEAKARPLAEAIIGEELYPATATDDEGYLLASFDGITMLEDAGWECKSWNEAKAGAVSMGGIPEEDRWQVVQQLVVSGAQRWLYMVTDGTPEKCVHVWCELHEQDRKALLAAWKQFDEDVANYQHVEHTPEPAGKAPEALPALRIDITGQVTASNLAEFKAHALAVFGAIKTDLSTDADFADAEKTVKWCSEVEERLDGAKQHALSQTRSIDELFRVIDELKGEARAKRLELDKLVKARKETIRAEIVAKGKRAYDAHIGKLNERLGRPYLASAQRNIPEADFVGVIKGKKTIKSLHEAVDAELARVKIAASEVADRVDANLKHLGDASHLFPDFGQLCTKAPEDFAALVALRTQQAKEREEARLEAERQRIRAEEEAKAKAEADHRAREEAARVAAEQPSQDQGAKASTEDVKPVPNTRTADAPGAVRREDEGTQVGKTSSPPHYEAEVDAFLRSLAVPAERKDMVRAYLIQFAIWQQGQRKAA